MFFTSCEYKKTSFELGTLFEPTIDFSKTSKVTFNDNFVELKNGKVQLKPLDLNQSGEDFTRGHFMGSHLLSDKVTLRQKDNSDKDIQNIISSSGLIANWKMDEQAWTGSVAEVIDSSGNDHHGTAIGAGTTTSQYSKVGDATAEFDNDNGVNNYVTIGSSSAFNFTSAFSISAWAKPFDDSNSQRIIYKYDNVTGDGFMLALGSSNRWEAKIWEGGIDTVVQSDLVITNNWQHLVMTRSISGDIKLFIDGILQSQTQNLLSTIDGVSDLRIGIDRQENYGFDGLIDDVSVFNRELSVSEVKAIFDIQSKTNSSDTSLSSRWAPKWDNILGYWQMDGSWQDSSGNGRHGITTIAPGFTTDAQVGSHSAEFDGVNAQRVSIPGLNNYSFQDFSMSMWLKVNVDDDDGRLIWQQNSNYWIVWYTGGVLRINFLPDTGGSVSTGYKINDGLYHHLVVSRDTTKGSIDVYIDGARVFTSSSGSSIYNIPTNVFIGSYTDGINQILGGNIDEVAIWDTALSSSEANVIYHRQKQKYSGQFDSEVIDLGSNSYSWPDFSWSTNLPFGKGLVGDFDNDGSSDGESISNYSFIFENLNSGLIGYWSFNETVENTISGQDFEDLSVNNNHCENSNGALGGLGVLGNGLSNGRSSCGVIHQFLGRLPYTISIWFLSNTSADPYFDIISNRGNPGGGLEGWTCYVRTSDGQLFCNRTVNNLQYAVSTPNMNDGRWHHLAFTYDGTTMNLYVDGLSVESRSNTLDLIDVSEPLRIGNYGGEGGVDEAAIWNRALTNLEVQQLYRRGANRIKFQVKSCIDSSCGCKSFSVSPVGSAIDCDGDTVVNALDLDDIHKAVFKGPGGDGTTYYSEAFNRKSTDTLFNCAKNTLDSDGNICVSDEISLLSSPQPEAPKIDFSNFPLSARPIDNQYIQYRFFMEAENNNACNTGPCLPELNSVNLGSSLGEKYFGSAQEVSLIEPIFYKKLKSVSIDADDCVSFQLSPDGVNYFYWNSNSWSAASKLSESTHQLDFTKFISNYSSQFSDGQLYIKTILKTNSEQSSNCAIKSIDIEYSD